MNVNISTMVLVATVLLAACSSRDGGGDGGTGVGSTNPDPSDFPSVGLPDQNSMSMSAEIFNPRAFGIDGTEVQITARLADQLNNNSTIPDGTDVFFAAEGGSIQPMCETLNGVCSVVWTSQNPRPAPGPIIDDPLGSSDQVFEYSAGRATILSWVEGTESFTDNNSNGLFDDGDLQVTDLPEAFMDKNENGARDVNEEFVNFPIPQLGSGGTYDSADGLYSGADCAHSSQCAENQSVFNFLNFDLTMSAEGVYIVPVGVAVTSVDPGYYPATTIGSTTLTSEVTFRFVVTDTNGNPPMAGTTVSFSTDAGTLAGGGSFTVPNTNVDMGVTSAWEPRQRYPLGSLVFSAVVTPAFDNTELESGNFVIAVETPAGDVFTYSFPIFDPIG